MEIAILIGVILLIVGTTGEIVEAFSVSVLWGLCSILFFPVAIAFIIMYWDRVKKYFLIQLLGFGMFGLAEIL